MTLADAFTIYTRRLHRKTLRPFLAYRVVNAANSNRASSPREGLSVLSLPGQPHHITGDA